MFSPLRLGHRNIQAIGKPRFFGAISGARAPEIRKNLK
jgi:hypothetical protein